MSADLTPGLSREQQYQEDMTKTLVNDYASSLNMTQQEGESFKQFQDRVAIELRRQGQIIEAHEVFSGKRWDDENQNPLTGPLAGTIGAIINEGRSKTLHQDDPFRQIGDEIALGATAIAPENPLHKVIRQTFDALGPELGAQLLLGEFRPGKNKS